MSDLDSFWENILVPLRGCLSPSPRGQVDLVFTSALAERGFDPESVVYDEGGHVISDGSDRSYLTIAQETRGVFENLQSVLAEAGCALSDVVDVSIWLKDARDFPTVNEVYKEYMGSTDRPCRSVFTVGFMFGCRIEIKAVAYKPLTG